MRNIKRFACLLFFVVLSEVCLAAVELECHVEQSGEIRNLRFELTTDPYNVPPVEFERFRIKAVAVGDTTKIEYVKIYTYYRSENSFILLHQSTYFSPAMPNSKRQSLTGDQRLYSPIRGHEIQYNCSLMGSQP